MATILLSAAGAAAGGIFGGGVFGLSSVVIGRAVGATIGRAIDARLMGSGSESVETGRLDRVRLMGAGEGAPIPRLFGRSRVSGHVIWASRFAETATTSERRGSKGAPSGPTTTSYSYSVSLAVAICEGEISRIGRVWVDGSIVPTDAFNMRVYKGTQDQLPDPLIAAIEGDGVVPAYRGVAYVVFEDLEIGRFGNRVPQFSFEVVRPAAKPESEPVGALSEVVTATAMMPGTGEYSLATTPIYRQEADGSEKAVNINSASAQPDFLQSLDAMTNELPNCKATSLVVSWFGDDLRIGDCTLKPKVERSYEQATASGSTPTEFDATIDHWRAYREDGAERHPWSVSGLKRGTAEAVSQLDDRPIYGGTPADASVVEAIEALRDAGQDVMFYPFILMEILQGNNLPDPWTGDVGQPALPWRGRIRATEDLSSAARDDVAQFMGTASVVDFSIASGRVDYSGLEEWSYRRFILHYAFLCKLAGGVSSFCIGSEMRAMTQIRDETGAFPAVEALQALAVDVKSILGPDTKIGYAADWSEYFGYQPQDGSGDVYFHLDPLWADAAIDFIGIDNYMPIADWRDDPDHADSAAGSIYSLDYLASNIDGGEGFDWYYRDNQERELQIRTPIEDGAHGEVWVYRYKDLVNWWSNPHHERLSGERSVESTDWQPQSKPIWFTELGCAAIDKGPNQPNKFLDPKSSESAIPRFSTGRRDDYVQAQYLRSYFRHFADDTNNPVSEVYSGSMVDISKTFVWAWDARPWPDFPANLNQWSDGTNHVAGHWITGRSAIQPLSFVVAEICEGAGITNYDVSELHGSVRGFVIGNTETPRASLQTLMLAYGFDAVEQNGKLLFNMRAAAGSLEVDPGEMVLSDQGGVVLEHIRTPNPEVVGTVRLGYTDAEGEFQIRHAEARFPDDTTSDTTQNEIPLMLTPAEAAGMAERWLSEARVARDRVSFGLAPSRSDVKVGELVSLSSEDGIDTQYRVDRIEDRGSRQIEAVRVEPQIYEPSASVESVSEVRPFSVPVPVSAQFMDLPLLKGDEVAHAPYVAAFARPWPGGAAIYSSSEDADYALNTVIEQPATLGSLETALPRAEHGIWDRGKGVRIRLASGALSSQSRSSVLNGANVAAIGDGSSDRWEIVQFSEAKLIGPSLYEIRDLLRGQAGSEAIIPSIWPVGSRFVLLNEAPQQIKLDLASRDLARHYRIGPALRAYSDPSFRYYVEAFKGVGLIPYAPAHLKRRRIGAAVEVTWIRRTRIDGDSWSAVDVPLGEANESYIVRVFDSAASMVREEFTTEPVWTYEGVDQVSDGVGSNYAIEVAQLSQSVGPGYFSRIEIDG